MSTNLIPVLTVDDEKYSQPTQNKGGLYVVNKGVLQNAPSNKFYLYDQNSDTYFHINEHTVSADYLKQINEYEQRLQNIGRVTADTTDPTQINSFADIVSILLSGDIVGAYKGTVDLFDNMVVTPLVTDDVSGISKATTILNNFLVNIGETLDYFTGANAIKAIAQGGDLTNAYIWGENKGRAQYDWNLEPTENGVLNFGTNLMLEILSDPTNWITFGGKAVVKNIITSSVDDVAWKMGLTVNEKYVKQLTRGLTSEFGTTTTLKHIDYKKLFNLADDVDPWTLMDIHKSLNTALEASKAMSNIRLVNSVMGTSDYYEKAAFKAAALTSTLGLEAMAVKGGAKYVLPWLNSKLGDILKYNGTNGEYKWSDYERVYREAEEACTVHNLITKSYDYLPKEAADAATSKVREDILRSIQKVVDVNKNNLDKVVSDLDELAKSKGFGGINDMYEYFVVIHNKVDGNVLPIVRKLEGILKDTNAAHNKAKLNFLDNVDALLRISIAPVEKIKQFKNYKNNSLEHMGKTLKALDVIRADFINYGLPVSDEVFNKAVSAVKVSNAIEGLQYIIAREANTSLYTQEMLNELLEEISMIGKLLEGEDVPNEVMSALASIHIYAMRLLNGSSIQSDEVIDLLDSAIDAIERVDDDIIIILNKQWNDNVEELSNILFQYRDSLSEEAAAVSDLIDLSGHRTAPILKEYRAKDNMLASTALKAQLDEVRKSFPNTPVDTSGAFIHPTDFKQLANAELEIAVDDFLPNTDYTMSKLEQYLITVLDRRELYGYEEDITLIRKVFEGASTNSLKVTVNDLEELIITLKRRANNLREMNSPSMDLSFSGDAERFESIAGNLADYIDAICIEQYGKMFVDAKQLYSKLYAVKLSQAASIDQLLNDPTVINMFNNILEGKEGVGAFIRTLEHCEGTSQAAEALHALAESTYVYGELLNGFRSSEVITDEWADALTDSLAGIMRVHISDIYLDDFTMDLLDKARLFINKSNSNMFNTNKYILDEFLPERQARVLADILFNNVRPDGMPDDYYAFYGALLNKLAESKEFNVVFSIGQHSKTAGVFEFVCELPEEIAGYGRRVHFVNDVVDYRAYYADPRYASEILGQKSPVQIQGDYAPNAIHFSNTDMFVKAISDFLETLKTHVNPPKAKSDEFRDIQFLGFGNSVYYNNQNKVLRDFFRQNNINFSLNNHISSRRNAKCVDIKELIHLDNGAVVITDELYAAVRKVIEEGKNELDSWNSKAQTTSAYVMPDLSNDVLNAIDVLTSEVESAYFKKQSGIKETSSLMEYSEDVLRDMSGVLRNFSNTMSSNLKSIRLANETYASELIVAKVFNELTGVPNIMEYVTKYLVDGSNGGLSELSLKIYHDPDLVASWYDLKIFEGKNISELLKVNELLKRLQRTSDSVARAELLYAPSSLAASDEVIETLRNLLEHHSTSVTVHRNIANIDAMHKGLMPEQSYAIAVYYMRELNKLPERTRESIRKMLAAKWERNLDAQSYWGLVFDAENKVLNKKGVYVPEIDSFKSMTFDESYGSVYHAVEAEREIRISKRIADCFGDTLKFEDETLSKHLVNSPVFKMQRSMIKAYTRFIDVVSNRFSLARTDFLDEIRRTDDAVKQYEHKQLYTERISILQRQLDELAEYHTYSRTHNILNMNVDTYEQYLFKYSQGVQVFDTSSKVLRDKRFLNSLLKRIEFLNSTGNKTSLRTAQHGKYIVIYVDKSVVDDKYIEKLRRTVSGYTADNGEYIPGITLHFRSGESDAISEELSESLKHNLFFRDYVWFQESMEHTHNVAYSMSTHRAMDVDKLKELYKNLPEEIVDKLLGADYWESANLVQSGLVHNVVGDYSSGLGDLFSTYSGNIVTNINSGFAKLYRQGVSKEAYVTLFTSPINSLKSRIDSFNFVFETHITAKEVHEAVEEMGYKVASFTGEEIKLFDVSTEKGLKEAVDNGAILIDAGLYDKVFRTMMDNSLPKINTGSDTLDYIVNCGLSYMHLLKLGQLQSPGWIMRNIIDSTVKGAVASDANMVEYVSMIPTVVNKLKSFDSLVKVIYDKEKSLSEFSIKRFFEQNPDEAAAYGLPLDQFLDYFNFSKNSASVPTPNQLSIFNNLEQRLLNMFSDESGIKIIHIRSLIKAFVEERGIRKRTEDALKEVHDDVTVQALMNVFDKIPKGYGKTKDTNIFSKAATWLTDHSFLMKWNNSIERMERFLAYDYNRMMGKTTGAAIDAVNTSQFNRAYDTVRKKIFEVIFPFSSFQIDNLMFWINALSGASGSVVGVLTDYLQAYQNEEELTPEEVATNASVQYMFTQGNIMVDEEGTLVLKTSDSLFNTMSLLADPMSYLRDAFNVPLEKLNEFFMALNQDEAEYKANPYGKVMPLSMWKDPADTTVYSLFNNKEYTVQYEDAGFRKFMIDFIPVFGAWWLRAKSNWTTMSADPLDTVLRRLAPSIFGRVKRTGHDWYGENDNDVYHDNHTFVPGISYVPKWLLADPMTYANTIERLVALGYDEDTAKDMVVNWGYYMKAPDYILRKYTPKVKPVRTIYPKKTYVQRPVYTKKVYAKKAYPKTAKMISGGDRYRTTRFGVARIYRLTSMYDRITKSGTSRMTMMLGRGHGASSIRVIRDRIKNNTIRRQRQRRILHM